MPLFRYRKLEDARRALWLPPGAPQLGREWNAIHELSLLAPAAPPQRGVRKFRDIEDANRDTEAWISQRVKAGRARVRESPSLPPG